MSKKTVECLVCGETFSSYNINPKYCSKKCKGEKQRHPVDFDEVVRLYESGMSQEEVAEALGTTQKVIYSRMKANGYTPRVAAKRNQTGELNDSWKGGRTKQSSGYVYVKKPDHPRALRVGDYVLEHILVAEDYIGRYLREGEIIHHINGIKDDNRVCNLYITSPREHLKMHREGWSDQVISNLDKYKEAYDEQIHIC